MKKIFNYMIIAACTLLLVTGCSVEKKQEFSMGNWEGNIYTNDFLGVTYSMPEDWTRTSDEELESLIEDATDLMEYNDAEKKLLELKAVYYLLAKSPTGSNLILGSEKVVGGVSDVKYAKNLKKQLESQENLNYTLSSVKLETINDKEFVTLEASLENIKQKYFIYKIDNHIIYLCVTGFTVEEIDEIVGDFQFN